jgi:hypothetical protein
MKSLRHIEATKKHIDDQRQSLIEQRENCLRTAQRHFATHKKVCGGKKQINECKCTSSQNALVAMRQVKALEHRIDQLAQSFLTLETHESAVESLQTTEMLREAMGSTLQTMKAAASSSQSNTLSLTAANDELADLIGQFNADQNSLGITFNMDTGETTSGVSVDNDELRELGLFVSSDDDVNVNETQPHQHIVPNSTTTSISRQAQARTQVRAQAQLN